MTNADIKKIRHLLQTALCPNVTNGCQDGIMPSPFGEMEQCQWCNKRKQALALLPCPTCKGTGEIMATFTDDLSGGRYGDKIPCPDCNETKMEKHKITKTTGQIIGEDVELSKLLSEIFLWIGRPYSVEQAVIKLRDRLQDKYNITFEIFT